MNLKALIQMALTVSVFTTAHAEDKQVSGKTFTFTIPEQVESKPPDNSDVYVFQWKSGIGTANFVISTTRLASNQERLHQYADELKKELEKGFMKDKTFKIRAKPNKDIELGAFKGVVVEFQLESNSDIELWYHQFILSDGIHTLFAPITAHSENDYDQACRIIKHAKRRVKTEKR